MDTLLEYFPDLTPEQRARFAQLGPLYAEWNQKINVVSRKDIDQLYKHHVLHSLALTRFINLRPGSKVLDLGCGGGFPGIPLAIVYPEVAWTLIDSTNKKLTVVNEVAGAIGLDNVTTVHTRVEDFKAGRGQYDFVISRAVASLPQLYSWSRLMLSDRERHSIPNGLIAYKGGNTQAMKEELNSLHRSIYRESYPIREWFKDEWFWEKYLVYCN